MCVETRVVRLYSDVYEISTSQYFISDTSKKRDKLQNAIRKLRKQLSEEISTFNKIAPMTAPPTTILPSNLDDLQTIEGITFLF